MSNTSSNTSSNTIYVGGAHASEYGTTSGAAGDSTGQEVSYKGYSGVNGVKAAFRGYVVYRPQDVESSSRMAKLMNTACNNNNVGYSQPTRKGIFVNHADSKVATNCDCSTLVAYCANIGGGANLPDSSTTSTLIGGGLSSSGIFFKAVPIEQIDQLYNGDILIKNGHTEMVCGGAPREGASDEIVTNSWTVEDIISGTSYSGNGALVRQYVNSFGQTFEFTPRLAKPFANHPSAEKEAELRRWYWTDKYDDWMRKYAWGRFSEIMKSEATLCQGDASQWYVSFEDSYSRGMAPQVGAIACWREGSISGYGNLLGVVESIGTGVPTGSELEEVIGLLPSEKGTRPYLLISTMTESGEFVTRRIFKTLSGTWDITESGKISHQFLGFIYNPGVSGVAGVPGISSYGAGSTTGTQTIITPGSESGTGATGGYIEGSGGGMIATAWSALQTFIINANNHVGQDGSFVKQLVNLNTETAAWSAAFVAAVALESGSSLNIVIPNTFSCSDVGRIGVQRNMGTWYDGPALGGNPPVQPGDLALFRTDGNTRNDKFQADKVGIVTEVGGEGINVSFNLSNQGLGTNQSSGQSFTAVIGDVEGKVAQKNYTTTSNLLSGIFHPYWEQIDGTSQSVQQFYTKQGMYLEGTSIEDVCIRDLRWVTLGSTGFEPSIQGKGMLLCAVNYTGMIANLYSALSESASSAATNADLVVDLWTNTVPSEFQQGAANTSNGSAESSSNLVPGEMSSGSITNPMSPDNSSTESSGSFSLSGSSVTVTAYRVDTGKSITNTITMNGTIQAIYKCLMGYLNNPAACIGVMANMWQESKFKTSSFLAQDWTLSYPASGGGLIGWTNTKYEALFDKMAAFCSTNGGSWQNNLEGQIAYIFYYAGMSEKGQTGNAIYANKWAAAGIPRLRGVPNNLSGAITAAKIFYSHWEVGEGNAKKYESGQGTARVTAEYAVRGTWASGLWRLFFGGAG